MDHTLHNLTIMARYQNDLKVVYLDDHSKLFLAPKKFEKWYLKDSILSLIPLGSVTGITTKNLAYPLTDETLTLGYRCGSSNHVAENGLVTIAFETGDLLLIES
jgi:thiamine pyrophosphokinase